MGKWTPDFEMQSAGDDPTRKPQPGEPQHRPGERPGEHKPGEHKPGEPHRKPGEEGDEPQQHQKTVAMTEEQLERLLRAARQPQIDERKERRMRMWREHNRQIADEDRRLKANRFHTCTYNHMQAPGSVLTGCSVIAWANQSDGKRRGHCMRCGTLFSPIRSECISDEIWQSYATFLRIPTHPAGNINASFVNA